MRWAGPVAHMVEMRYVYKTFVGKPEGKGPLWRPIHRWEDNIEMSLKEICCEGLEWIHLVKDRVQ